MFQLGDLDVSGVEKLSASEVKSTIGRWKCFKFLGNGSCGRVYKGKLNGKPVAVKRLKSTSYYLHDREKREENKYQLLAELKALKNRRHENIVTLLSYCDVTDKECLIYEYVPKGTLRKRLFESCFKKPLKWMDRLKIAIGIAEGLDYLHNASEKALVHCDIKPENILLDENLVPKICDFGCSQECDRGQVFIAEEFRGTYTYLPNEYISCNEVSTKVDVHSFGVLLYQIATGMDKSKLFFETILERLSEKEKTKYIIKKSGMDSAHNILYELLSVAKKCCVYNPDERPEIHDVVEQLKQIEEREIEKDDNTSSENCVQGCAFFSCFK